MGSGAPMVALAGNPGLGKREDDTVSALFAVDDDVPEPMRYKAEMFKRRTELLRDEIVCCLDWLNLDQTDRLGSPLTMAIASLDEVLLRLRDVTLPGEPQDTQDDPLVLGVQPGVRTQ